MKLYIFLRLYGPRILLVVILLMRLQTGLTPFRAFAETTFVIVVFLTAFLSGTRYLREFVVQGNRIKITYLNQFLQLRSIEKDRSDITNIRLAKKHLPAALWPPVLGIKTSDDYIYFIITRDKLYKDIKTQTSPEFNSMPVHQNKL